MIPLNERGPPIALRAGRAMTEASSRDRTLRGFLRSGRPFGRVALVAGAVVAVAALLHAWTAVRITGASVRAGDGPATPIVFPYSVPVAAGQVMEFAFTIRQTSLTQRSIVFVPDDHFVSLSVDGRDVPLDGVDPKQRDDYHRGFRFPIGLHLRPGDNSLVARVLDRDGPGGLDVESDPRDWVNCVEVAFGLAGALVLLALALRRLDVPWTLAGPFVAGVALRIGYLSVTPYSLRDHDVAGHIEYVEYVLNHHSLPGSYDGWSFYHPPLYYILAAALWKALVVVGVHSRDGILWALQVQSMVYEFGFVAFALGTATLWLAQLPDAAFGRRLMSRSWLGALLAALLCVWPSGVIHSVRIGNDDLFYLWFAAGVYFASRWWVGGRDRDLHVAAACGALDPERKVRTLVRRAWPGTLLFLLSTGAALGRALVDMHSGKRSNLLMGNVHDLQNNLLVGDRAQNFLWFDTKTFVNEAFMSPLDDAKGRQFFWNYTLKSSLFGEFSFAHPQLWDLAVVLSVLLLFVAACVLLGFALSRRDEWLSDLPAIAATATLFASLAAIRAALPMSAVGDFRYIVPVLGPALYLYVRYLLLFRERGWTRLALTGSAVGWSFAACSTLFFAILTATG
jgi:hypothetical protein